MLRNCHFLNADEKNLDKYLRFSTVPKRVFYDHRSSILMCHDFNSSDKERKRSFNPSMIALRDSYDFINSFYDQSVVFDRSANHAKLDSIRQILKSQRERLSADVGSLTDNMIYDYVDMRDNSARSAVYSRIKRFGRKALLNRDKFNYFVTFTRDDKCFDDESLWQSTLVRRFSNLADRYDIKFMGCFERGSCTNRLHFHALVSVPDISVLGDFSSVRRKSDSDGLWHVVNENVDFRKKFGENEWDNIQGASVEEFHRVFSYVFKYVTKMPVKFYYSRYLPSEVFRFVDFDNVYFSGEDSVEKFYLNDDSVLSSECTLYLRPVTEIFGPPDLPF